MKNFSFTEFLSNQCFNFLVSIFASLLTLVFVGIFLYSFGLPMPILYYIVGLGFLLSISFSFYSLQRKHKMAKMISSDSLFETTA